MRLSSSTVSTLLSLLVLSNQAWSVIEGSDHDLTGSGSSLCSTCHVPHNALGEALWSSPVSDVFAGVRNLCYSCHDGSITSVGTTTVFDASKDQHIMIGEDCSATGGCHDVHNQNPREVGRFLVDGITRTNKSYCETCHDETPFPGAEHLGVHNTENSHYTDGVTFICEGCHSVHGAVLQSNNPPNLTHPILLADDCANGTYGEFCITCHKGVAPDPAIPGTGAVASGDPFTYAETRNDGSQSKHTTHAVGGRYPLVGCLTCHVNMCRDAPALEKYDLRQDNANSTYCVSCHASGAAPHVGENTHFTQGEPSDPAMNQGLTPQLPWSHEIDEDGNPGPDWSSATANMMTCETCHSVHRKGFNGNESAHLLRYPDDDENALCRACHTGN